MINQQLETLLIKNSKTHIRCANQKEVTTLAIEQKIAFNKFKFIEFNSDERISWLIYDIDTPANGITDINHYRDYIQHYLMLPVPTFITKTTKGFHVAYLLKYGILESQKSANQYLKFVHVALGQLLDADVNAMRLKGIWRNPLKHTHLFYDRAYTLDELVANHGELVNENSRDNVLNKLRVSAPAIQTTQAKSLSMESSRTIKYYLAQLITSNRKVVPVGYRKSVLFQAGMLFAKKQTTTLEELKKYVQKKNRQMMEEFKQSDIDNIIKSVWKYKEANSIYVSNPTVRTLPKRAEQYIEQPLHVRQSRAALGSNKLRIAKTKVKIELAIKSLLKRDAKITLVGIGKEAGLSKQTIHKYKGLVNDLLLVNDKARLRAFFLSLRFQKQVNHTVICFTTLPFAVGGFCFWRVFRSMGLFVKKEFALNQKESDVFKKGVEPPSG